MTGGDGCQLRLAAKRRTALRFATKTSAANICMTRDGDMAVLRFATETSAANIKDSGNDQYIGLRFATKTSAANIGF